MSQSVNLVFPDRSIDGGESRKRKRGKGKKRKRLGYGELVDYTEQTIDEATLAEIRQHMREFQFIPICMDSIIRAVLSDGIVFMINNKSQDPTPTFEEVISRWYTFVEDFITRWHTDGIVPVSYERIMSQDGIVDVVPIVPKPELGKITVMVEQGRPVYRFYHVNAGNYHKDKPAFWYDQGVSLEYWDNTAPGIDGQINSKLSHCLEDLRMLRQLRADSLLSNKLSSNPPSFLQPNKSALIGPDMYKGTMEVVVDYFADSDLSIERREDQIRQDVDIDERLAAHGNRYAPNTSYPHTSKSIEHNRYASSSNMVSVPNGLQLVTGMLPRPTMSYEKMLHIVEQRVCLMFSVPRSRFLAEGNIRGDYGGMQSTFNDKVNSWKRIIERLLTRIYRALYGDLDGKYFTAVEYETQLKRFNGERRYARRIDDRRGKRQKVPENGILEMHLEAEVEPLTYEQVEAMRTKHQVSVVLPRISPDLATLAYMNARGLMDFDNFSKHALRSQGLPTSIAASQQDPLSEEERKMMLLGKKLTATSTTQQSLPKIDR